VQEVIKILREQRIRSHLNQGIQMAHVSSEEQGFVLVKEILYKITDRKTALYLSGGRTPKGLYVQLAHAEKLRPGVVGLVDERFGSPMHEKSNEKMLQDTGLQRYFTMTGVTFHPILQYGMTREEIAERYDQELRELLAQYQLHVAILGVGIDGHTAGLPAPASLGLQGDALQRWTEDFEKRSKNCMVIDYDDKRGFYKERVTMTFLGLSMMDFLIVLVFGEDKKEALDRMFSDGLEEEIPSRFFKRPEIARKTLVITDQEV
jgi:6-phosphogluconolactonase/glucosamine-6-phosphate isomerase/deaminase